MKRLTLILLGFLAQLILVATHTYAAATEDIVFYHNDIIGNPVAATDESGAVIWQESYTAFGEKTIKDESSNNNPLAFTGHYQDRESGLVYMGARYYSPELGRFISPDPADFVSQVESNPMLFNRYAYANNNPYKYTDPDGETPVEIATELLPAAGRSFAALALYANGMINNDQAMMNVALEVMRENQVDSLIAIASVAAPPGAGRAYKFNKASRRVDGSCCFVAGTQIVTESGSKSIELIELGELVLSKEVETGEQAYKPVTRLYERKRVIYELRVAHTNGREELIETTDDHPFYVVGSGFVDVIDLMPGNTLTTATGESIAVLSVVNSGRVDTVYNIEVADFHTYYATEYEILVHNCHYFPAPKKIEGIPDLTPAKPKTPVQGGGGLRRRWKDKKGNIFEWDSQHGRVEKYNKRGKHLGEFDPASGKQTKPADKTRKVEP